MPTLAKQLVDRGGVPNFKGFFVGNPLSSGPLRDLGEFLTLHGHQLIPRPLFTEFHKNDCMDTDKLESVVCQHLLGEARAIASGLDPYGLDFPICTVREEKMALLSKLGLLVRKKSPDSPPVLQEKRRALQYFPNKYQPCEESYTTSWLNRPDVKKALHVREGAPAWSGCNNYINIIYNQTDVQLSMVPLYQYLVTKPIKIWIYSGDDDTVCATASDQQWIWDFPASSRWNPWHVDGQVAGYTVHFKGFVYSTVHGAGHMVPSTRPKQALELLSRFLRA